MSHTAVKVESQHITIQYDNALAESAVSALTITYHGNPQVRQPPYLPDMISFIYFPIPKLKQNLK
jgi:hypothetical protein